MPGTVPALGNEKACRAIALESDLVAPIDDGVHVVTKFLLAGKGNHNGLRATVERDNAALRDGRIEGLLGAGGWRPCANYCFRVTDVYQLQRTAARGRLLGLHGRHNQEQEPGNVFHISKYIYRGGLSRHSFAKAAPK